MLSAGSSILGVNYRSITIVLRETDSYPEINVDFARLPKRRLDRMLAAGTEAVECIQVLSKTGDNIAGELLKGRENFFKRDHYPTGDVYDYATHAQFNYNDYPRELISSEHGHFQLYLLRRSRAGKESKRHHGTQQSRHKSFH